MGLPSDVRKVSDLPMMSLWILGCALLLSEPGRSLNGVNGYRNADF